MTSVRIRGLPWFSRYLPYETHAAKSHSVPAIFRLLFGVAFAVAQASWPTES
jgi:hypothetical protein